MAFPAMAKFESSPDRLRKKSLPVPPDPMHWNGEFPAIAKFDEPLVEDSESVAEELLGANS